MMEYKINRVFTHALLLAFCFSVFACKTDDLAMVELPELGTINVSTITQSSARVEGSVVTDGGGRIKVSGVCWNTSPQPTVADKKTTNGPTEGSFKASLTELLPYTTYYARAYATNDAGTVYGDEVQFTTTQELVELTTLEVTDLTEDGAKSGGTILANGETIIEKGLCWSSSGEPTIDGNHVVLGDVNGDFEGMLSNLIDGVTYRVRAYAINNGGVGYGNIVQFTTPMSTVVDVDGNVYHSVRIGDQVWMVENLKVRHFSNGDPIEYLDTNDPYLEPYGYLYLWTTITDPRGVAPDGWRVPSDEDWAKLNSFLGSDAAGKLKALDLWAEPNNGATNQFGFSAYAGGLDNGGGRQSVNQIGFWWTSTAFTGNDSWRWAMTNADTGLFRSPNDGTTFKMSVRLIRSY